VVGARTNADAQGNVTQDGRFIYAWDDSAWVLADSRRFLYDQWNLIAEINDAGSAITTYAWGPDLSGTMQGAGGVGGLLIVQSGSTSYYPAYDGNGNVLGYINQTGQTIAQFEYGPFGEYLSARVFDSAGRPISMAQGFTGAQLIRDLSFGFSTKYRDSETGLNYYGYRYYRSNLGRWMGRDPIEEVGGINLCGFVWNAPLNFYDRIGLKADKIEEEVSAMPIYPSTKFSSLTGWTDGPLYEREDQPRAQFSFFRINDSVVEVIGRVRIEMYYNPHVTKNISPDKYITTLDRTKQTLIEHERHHAVIIKVAYNSWVDFANQYERKYCKESCAEKAITLVNMGYRYWRDKSEYANTIYDMNEYGHRYWPQASKTQAAKQRFDKSKGDYESALRLYKNSSCGG
jgi:RHS repeat-associated protein